MADAQETAKKDVRDLLKVKERAQSESNFTFVGLKMEKDQAAQLEELLGLEAGAGGAEIFRAMLQVVIDVKTA